MVKKKKQESSTGTPIQTPTQTPERPVIGNSFEVLRPESDAKDQKSVDTITSVDDDIPSEAEIAAAAVQ
jgi:hypothetical protein